MKKTTTYRKLKRPNSQLVPKSDDGRVREFVTPKADSKFCEMDFPKEAVVVIVA